MTEAVATPSAAIASRGQFPSSLQLLARHAWYQIVYIVRVPVALFFTIIFPVMLLILFNALFGDGVIEAGDGEEWSAQQFYVGGLAAFTAATATYTNLANMVPIRRDEGVLKRWRSTPVPTWVYIGGFVVSGFVFALVGTVLMLTMGTVFYELQIEWAKMPAAFVTFVVGVCALAALGLAVAALVPQAEAASAVANATILPLAFASDIFVVVDEPPRWLELVGDAFPLKPFVNSFQDCFNPFVDAPAFNWGNLAFITAWGIAGAAVAVWRFRWEPSTGGSGGRRRRRGAAIDAA